MTAIELVRSLGTFEEPMQGEGVTQYHAFCHYRDLGAGRSIAKALDVHKQGCGSGKTRATGVMASWEKWSTKFVWTKRSQAFEVSLDSVKLSAQRQEAVAMGVRHARKAAEAIEVLSQPAMMVARKLQESPEVLELFNDAMDDPKVFLAMLEMARDTTTAMPALAKMEAAARGITEEAEPEETTVRVIIEIDEHFKL